MSNAPRRKRGARMSANDPIYKYTPEQFAKFDKAQLWIEIGRLRLLCHDKDAAIEKAAKAIAKIQKHDTACKHCPLPDIKYGQFRYKKCAPKCEHAIRAWLYHSASRKHRRTK